MFDYKFIIMKISEVIKKLQEIQEEHGDLDVITYKKIRSNMYVRLKVDEKSFLINKDRIYL